MAAGSGEPAAGDSAATAAPRRVVLLGASNLTRGISTVVELSRRIWGRPLEVLAALGHGRSYGLESRMLGRGLPGIVDCGLWSALAAGGRVPTAALVTDIGNDILYQATVDEIIGWVAACFDRLQAADAKIVVTLLPSGSLARLTERRYRIVRRVLFPRCGLTWDQARERADELNARLADLAAQRRIVAVEQLAEWYGFDPIHIKLRHWPRAWREILTFGANSATPVRTPLPSLARWLYLRRLAPETRTLFGRRRWKVQPAGRLRDGTTISLY